MGLVFSGAGKLPPAVASSAEPLGAVGGDNNDDLGLVSTNLISLHLIPELLDVGAHQLAPDCGGGYGSISVHASKPPQG